MYWSSFYMGCSSSNQIRGNVCGYTVENDSGCTTRWRHQIRKLSSYIFFFFFFWNKQYLAFAFERWGFQDVILEPWCAMTVWRTYITRSSLRFWSNFLARMLRREPRSFFLFFSGWANLDEAGGVWMTSAGAHNSNNGWLSLWERGTASAVPSLLSGGRMKSKNLDP